MNQNVNWYLEKKLERVKQSLEKIIMKFLLLKT